MCRQFDSSQHHSNPLIISGFSFSVPLSVPLLGKNSPLSDYTEKAHTRRYVAVFEYTLRHYVGKKVVFTFITDNELQSGTELLKVGRTIVFPMFFS